MLPVLLVFLCHGNAEIPHDAAVITLLETARANNLTFNPEKFVFKSQALLKPEKYVVSFFFACLFCFTVLLVSILYVPCINHTVLLVFFFSFLSYMANLFYYSMYVPLLYGNLFIQYQ